MPEFDPVALAALSKKHLDLPPTMPDHSVPKFYIDELRRHLILYPQEDNFRVTLQPNHGFGTVTCLKNNCNEVIPLIRRVRARDGGIYDGLGSLSAYRNHISSHHQRIRVKLEEDFTSLRSSDAQLPMLSTDSIKRESLPPVKQESTPCLVIPRIKAENATQVLSSHIRVKNEPLEPKISRKRLSETAFTPVKLDPVGNPELVASSPSKKQKTERLAGGKIPFSPVTNNLTPVASTSVTSAPMYSSFNGHEDLQVHLEDIQIAIAGQQHVYDRLSRDPRCTTQTLIEVNDEINRLRMLEQSYQPVITSNSPPQYSAQSYFTPAMQQGGVYNDMQESTYWNGALATEQPGTAFHSWSALPDQDRKPVIDDYHYQQPFASSSSSPSSSSTLGTSYMGQYSDDLPPTASDFHHLAHITNSASGSSSPQPVHYQHAYTPSYPSDYDMDDEQDSQADHSSPMPEFANPFIDGIRAPAPIYDDAHDDNGDYHGRGRDLFEGPQAAHDDITKFLVEAGNAEAFDGNESVDKALQYLGLNSLHDKLPGMEISLMAHQVMGVAWMLEKEKSSLQGGCLADEMGLGKTIQTIACMVTNKSADPKCKTNLIIAPLALLDQWKFEIEERTNCGLTCLIYHGPAKTKKRAELLKYDVVLTTANTMASEWPDYEKKMKEKAKAKRRKDAFIVPDSDEEDMKSVDYRSQKRKKEAGPLFQVEFFRISVDEGQIIRNRATRMARAITDLRATYRWILTGTPIVNSLTDVYSYLRFLQVRPWYDWTKFHGDIGKLEKKNPTLAAQRLQKVMATFLLRRKKDSKLDGKNLVDLPEKEVVIRKLEFSEEERAIYSMVETRTQAKFNRYLKAGTVLKNYHQVLVLLLRLRQICSHPSLIQEDGVALTHADDANVEPVLATELTRARRLVSNEFVEKMKLKLKENALARLSSDAAVEDEDCPICFDVMTEPVITSCTHVFCRDCILDVINRAPAIEAADNDKNRPCPVCRANINGETLFSQAAFEPSKEELNIVADEDASMDVDDAGYLSGKRAKGKGKARKSGPPKRRGTDNESDDEGDDVNDSGSDGGDDDDNDDLSDFIVASDEDEEEKDARRALKKRLGKKRAHVIVDSDDEPESPEEKEVLFGTRKKTPDAALGDAVPLMSRFLPSTKMKYMMDQLQALAEQHPEEKTLIVSQWTGCLSLVSDYLSEKGIPHVKYQGDMNRAKRDQAVRVFMSREKARVMLMSLKCGGVGLNLTRANNVISLDLGWSLAVESQAYDRVHRLGQTRKVTVQRVVIADTVEDRILERQNRKQMLADGSLGEGTGQKMGRLSVKELANLFGLDGRGNRL